MVERFVFSKVRSKTREHSSYHEKKLKPFDSSELKGQSRGLGNDVSNKVAGEKDLSLVPDSTTDEVKEKQ